MSESIGNIVIPVVTPTGTFPIPTEYGMTTTLAPSVYVHLFQGANIKREQRYFCGADARTFVINRELDEDELFDLQDFWETHQGTLTPFTFALPLQDHTTVNITVAFANKPIQFDRTNNGTTHCQIELIEVTTAGGPTYTVAGTDTRFPGDTLYDALSAQAQQFIKLVKIQPRLSTYPAMYLADQRCTVGGQLYQPRLLKWDGIGQIACGMPGVGTESDDVTLVFGNADRVMRKVADDVQLDRATVSCSAYHVGSGIKIDLWSGVVVPGGWASNSGPEFTLKCSDPISSPFLLIPPRIIDRRCSVRYNDDNDCPFDSVGALDTDNYPDADDSFCDHGWDTANGCLAHGMKLYYNGIVANPQAVRIGNGSFFHPTQNLVSVSLIADSAYGQGLPIVVTGIPLPVAVIMIEGRDEGDFYEGLGIVCEGPVVFQLVGHSLDGKYNHGYPDTLGLRTIPGNTPSDESAPIAMDAGGSFQDITYSAGTAGIVIRVSDEQGLQITDLASHSMEAIIQEGWHGWVWTASGDRADANLTNPVWLAVNVFLLALRLKDAPIADAEAMLDLDSIIAAADICDLAVDRLVELDEGQETQFLFCGVIRDRKSLRDWLSDILLNCLGIYSFTNGKLAISIRENASAVAAYTDGNIIFQSIQLNPLGPTFTRLTGQFADAEHQFVGNTATFQDDDYAEELGGGVLVLHTDAQINLVGTADISPATRIVVTRGREEMGGVDADERKAARRVQFKTTALGFDTGPGSIVSITQAEMPGGFAKFRVERWKLNDDWTIEITGRCATASMYDLVAGPKPADVRPDEIPGELGAVPLHPAWQPFVEGSEVGDPIWDPNDHTFSLQQIYNEQADGTVAASLLIGGWTPINTLQTFYSPRIRKAVVSSTGGALLGGHRYYFSICARLGNVPSPISNIIQIFIPEGTDTNSVELTGLTWPSPPEDGPGWDGYILFASMDEPGLIAGQADVDEMDVTSVTSLTINDALFRSTYNQPSALSVYNKIKVKIKLMLHPGVIPVRISTAGNLGGFGVLVCSMIASDGITAGAGHYPWADPVQLAADNWTGYRVSVISNNVDGFSRLQDYTITAYDAATGTMTLDREISGSITTNDAFIIRFIGTLSDDHLTLTDETMSNGCFPGSLDVSDRSGAMIRILQGPGRGQTRLVASNTRTSYTADRPWDAANLPDSTSVWVVENTPWVTSSETSPLSAGEFGVLLQIPIDVNNWLGTGLYVVAVMENDKGVESPERISPQREMFLYGTVSFGQSSKGTLAAQFIFGRGADGGPADVAVDDTSNVITSQFKGLLKLITTIATESPTGSATTIDFQRYDGDSDTWETIKSVDCTEGNDNILETNDFASEEIFIEEGDRLRAVINTVGSTTPGKSITMDVYWGSSLGLVYNPNTSQNQLPLLAAG